MGHKHIVALFFAGVILLFLALVQGDAKAGFFVIFPYISGSGILTAVGVSLIMLSMGVFLFAQLPSKNRTSYYQTNFVYKKRKAGGIIFIGPIPVIIANDRQMAIFMAIIATIVILLFIGSILVMFFL